MSLEQSRSRRAARTAPGARVGEYLLERALGSGAMGSVFVARHAVTGARHALKVLHLGAGPERRERFAREARALGKVDRHPGVIRIHRYDVEPDGLAYCALDLVEGSDLERLLEAHPAGLPPPRALAIAEGLARALAHVHAAGVVHRDLKPGNVLLPAGTDQPVLTDFGVARDEAEERLTLTQQLVGTPHYMAPEQVVGDQGRVGPPTDVFALGVLLLQLLTGALPFEGSTFIELTGQICGEEPALPRAHRPELPRDVDRVVALMLEKDPARRPTAAQVAEWLAALGRGEALALAGSSTLQAAVRRLRRGRGVALALAAALVATGGVVALALGREDPARVRARTTAVAEAQADVARLDAGTLDRLVARTPPDVAAIDSARGRLAAFAGDGDDAVGAALSALEAARARATAEAALLRGDADAARQALGRGAGGAAALLALRAAALESAPEPASVAGAPAGEAAALRADAALDRGDVEAARGHLEQVREPALGAVRRLLETRLDLVRAEQAAGRLDGPAVVSALKAAAARDPEAARAGAARAVSLAVGAIDPAGGPAGAAQVVRAVHAAFPGVSLAGAARPLHALAVEAARARRPGQVLASVEEAWGVDPDTPPPVELAALLASEGAAMIEQGQASEGYRVLLHAVRAGRLDPIPTRRLVRLHRDGVLDAWVRAHPDDWAGRFVRADTAVDGIAGLAAPQRELVATKALEDLEVVLERTTLTRTIRDLAELARIEALSHTPGHLARIEALLARGHLRDWKLCQLAALHCAIVEDLPGEVAWSRRAIAAIQRRIDRIQGGDIEPGGNDFFDGAHQLLASYERLSLALVRSGDPEAMRRLVEEVQRNAILDAEARAEVLASLYSGLGRWREARDAARVRLMDSPDNLHMQRIVETAEEHLRGQE